MKRSNKVPTNSQTKASQYNHERDHLLWLVSDRARLPFASLTIVTITDPYYWRAYHLYGKSGNSGRIQMEPFIPVECLRKKVTFPRYYFFPLLPERPILYHLFVYQSQASTREKAKNLPVFCTWYSSSPGAKREKNTTPI